MSETHARHAELPADAGFETLCEHYAEDRLAHGGGAVPPIYQNSTFVYPSAEAFERRKDPDSPYVEYTRASNPTTNILQAKIAKLERGQWARAFGSGMGAVSSAINACIKTGNHVVCVSRVYYPTRQYLKHIERFGVSTTYVKGVDPVDFAAAMRPETSVLYLESPTSGFGDCPPIAALTELAHERGVRVIFDNSLGATPYFLRPLDLGCDLVVHSATKFFGGHSDVVAGVVIGCDAELETALQTELELSGAVCDPFAAWLLIRGLRTLPVRMDRHQASALRVAEFLAGHDRVKRVYHPGLPEHPHHDVAKAQLRGYSSLFGFTPVEQSREACNRIINRLRLFSIGVSWGGHESLVLGGDFFSDPARPEWFIRLHVGLETVDDLIADLRQALEV